MSEILVKTFYPSFDSPPSFLPECERSSTIAVWNNRCIMKYSPQFEVNFVRTLKNCRSFEWFLSDAKTPDTWWTDFWSSFAVKYIFLTV